VSARAGSGQLRRGSGTVNKQGLGLPAAVQNEQTVYDIIYDINVDDINVGSCTRNCFDPISMTFCHWFLIIF
jgi:hypothetical protein